MPTFVKRQSSVFIFPFQLIELQHMKRDPRLVTIKTALTFSVQKDLNHTTASKFK